VTFRQTTLLPLALAAAFAAGCGSDDENGKGIPPAAAQRLQAQLDSISNRFQAGGGACGDITGGADPNTRAVDQVLASLPKDTDPEVRDALEQSFDRLFELTDEQCDTQKGQETETEEEAPPPETDTETETETTPEEPEQTETEEVPPPEETQPEEPVPPEGGEGEQGGGGDETGGGGVFEPGGEG
jgi:outer membrane biosynthesis protein TonB